jgi:23S rRNA (cytosine1962-C5)-methyltransferase
VDASERAVNLTELNVLNNFPDAANHRAFACDAFDFLEANKPDSTLYPELRTGEQYDLIVLDPPAFAKHRDAIKNALKGYQRLNAKAMQIIKFGGILFTFSCSQAIDKDMFRRAVFSAAAQTGRKVRILYQLHQPADHPVNIYHPEGEYLKGLVLYIE